MSGKPVFDKDYTPALNHAMEKDADGFWWDRQQAVDLSLSAPAQIYYRRIEKRQHTVPRFRKDRQKLLVQSKEAGCPTL